MSKTKVDIQKAVTQIKIAKRGTAEGNAQREAFRIRWGKKPEDV